MDHMLDDLNALFQGGDLDGHLVVLVGPLLVFSLSLGGPGLDGVHGLLVVALSLGQIDSCLLKNILVVGDARS